MRKIECFCGECSVLANGDPVGGQLQRCASCSGDSAAAACAVRLYAATIYLCGMVGVPKHSSQATAALTLDPDSVILPLLKVQKAVRGALCRVS